MSFKLTRVPTLKTVPAFRDHLAGLGLELPCDETVLGSPESPLAQAVTVAINGKFIGNRIAVQPMEGWDGTRTGGITDEVRRRWQRFGESGAKLICGGEAMAVRPDGRANPNQLILQRENLPGLRELVQILRTAHQQRYGSIADLLVGFQLTHSGRFCRPNSKDRLEPRVAFRHPILDRRFQITQDDQVFRDDELPALVRAYVDAADLAVEAGAEFVDIKHCHGYLLHEFLGAHTRPGPYGGSFENRTRLLQEIVQGIRQRHASLAVAVRLSAFDFVPFRPDPALSQPRKLGPGIPEEYPRPYPYAFGVNPNDPLSYDLSEPLKFLRLCAELGIQLVNLTAGSPYYNPHIQRPAAYPPSDGYQPAHDPLIDVVRQIQVVRQLRAQAPKNLLLVGSAYSYLQEFLPHVAQGVLRNGWTDLVGIGRMTLSYPNIFDDALNQRPLNPKHICRTFSDCTTAPRNGMISGCYPLDPYYTDKPEAQRLKELKRSKA